MEKLIIFSIALGLSIACHQKESAMMNEKRIIDGKKASIEDFPYQLQMQVKDSSGKWQDHCGGVIIGDKFALTAAHCAKRDFKDVPKENIRFLSGSATRGQGIPHTLKHWKIHEDYSKGRGGPVNDIAIAEVSKSFEFGSDTQKIELADEEPSDGQQAIVSGVGVLKPPYFGKYDFPDTLLKGHLKIVGRDACKKAYKGDQTVEVRPSMICAKDKKQRICFGDSGGPCVVDGKLVGLSSFGGDCHRDVPGIFTNVYMFKPWIKKAMDGWSK